MVLNQSKYMYINELLCTLLHDKNCLTSISYANVMMFKVSSYPKWLTSVQHTLASKLRILTQQSIHVLIA